MNSTELIVTKHETSVTSRPHSQFQPCVTHHLHHLHLHPTVNQWRCLSDSSLVTLAVLIIIITTDDEDEDWQSRVCRAKKHHQTGAVTVLRQFIKNIEQA